MCTGRALNTDPHVCLYFCVYKVCVAGFVAFIFDQHFIQWVCPDKLNREFRSTLKMVVGMVEFCPFDTYKPTRGDHYGSRPTI